jgi:hypothetical protein
MKKLTAPRKTKANNDLKRANRTKFRQDYIHSLRGSVRGKGLLKALAVEKRYEREL